MLGGVCWWKTKTWTNIGEKHPSVDYLRLGNKSYVFGAKTFLLGQAADMWRRHLALAFVQISKLGMKNS